jgi:hypothetical protein
MNLDYSINIEYNKHESNILSEYSEKFGSDKGATSKDSISPLPWSYHNYTDFYALLFDHCRYNINNVFELGIGTNYEDIPSSMTSAGSPGASLRMWKEYFPNANIFGADIDSRILFEEDRINTFQVDQTSKGSIKSMWGKIDNVFDLMIDDGLHEYSANITFFENSFHKVSSGGVYIIEDVAYDQIEKYQNYFSKNNYNYMSIVLNRPNSPVYSNCLIVIRKP